MRTGPAGPHRRAKVHHPDCQWAGHIFKADLRQDTGQGEGQPEYHHLTVSTGGLVRAITEGRGGMGGAMRDMDYLQADNEMRTFSSSTGGMSFFPRFEGEMPDIFQNINQTIRSKYELVYRPSNAKQDGSTASCGWRWWTTRDSRCASRTRRRSHSNTTLLRETATGEAGSGVGARRNLLTGYRRSDLGLRATGIGSV